MKKSYCDKCGVEVTSDNEFKTIKVNVSDVDFFLKIADAIPYEYDVCKYCVLDEIAAQDDRLRPPSPTSPKLIRRNHE